MKKKSNTLVSCCRFRGCCGLFTHNLFPLLLLLLCCSYYYPSAFSNVGVSAQSCGTFLDNSTTLVFYPDNIDLRTNAPNPSYPNYLDFQGLRLILNETNGFLQVIETLNSNVVWSWGLTGQSCTGLNSCKVVFQSDGNFVLYYPNSAVGTTTYNQHAQYLYFQTSPPYISIVNTTCAQLWPNKQYYPNFIQNRSTPILSDTFDVQETGLQALSANVWKSHFGMNTHCSQGWNSEMVYNLTTYLGVGIIRDAIPAPFQQSDFARMFNEGIRLNVVANGVSNISELENLIQTWVEYQSIQPNMILQIEGFNEINNFGFIYNNFLPNETFQGMAEAMNDLYRLVKSNAVLSNIPVLDLTGGGFSNGIDFGLTNYTSHADIGNVHCYQYSGSPTISINGAKNAFLLSIGSTYPIWSLPTSDFSMTETGYYTYSDSNGVSENAQGILVVNTLLNGLYVGLRQTFIYELIDEVWQGYEGPESHYGLFRNDQTPKPAALALHLISSLLNDSLSQASPSQLSFSLQTVPVGTFYLLFQNSQKTFYLILWNNSPVYNPVTQSDIQGTIQKATLTIASPILNLNVYDIFGSFNSSVPNISPITSTTNNNVQFSISSNTVIVIEITLQEVGLGPDDSSTATSPTKSHSLIYLLFSLFYLAFLCF